MIWATSPMPATRPGELLNELGDDSLSREPFLFLAKIEVHDARCGRQFLGFEREGR